MDRDVPISEFEPLSTCGTFSLSAPSIQIALWAGPGKRRGKVFSARTAGNSLFTQGKRDLEGY